MARTLKWIGDPGPLVLLPARAGRGWVGFQGADYDRLCKLVTPQRPLRAVPFDGGVALGIETTGHQATYLRFAGGIVIAKWIYAPNREAATKTLRVRDLATTGKWKRHGRWRLDERTVRLQPAAGPFGEACIRFALEPGEYDLADRFHAPDEETGFELFRLTLR